MTPQRWQSLYRIFDAAVELPAAQRSAFLDRECAGDAALRAEIESLLRADSGTPEVYPEAIARLAADYVAQSGGPLANTIGAYEIVAPIGSGGMGQVYLARDTRLDRNVALKILPSEFTSDPYRLHRFHQEARAASALNHPNILVVHEVGESGGRQFIATEYVEGRTLRDILSQGPLPIDRLLDIAIQSAAALAAAHDAGIVHRDIKPENIMLRQDGFVKVLDFGLAKVSGEPSPASEARTVAGMVVGTLKYMSPEQARGRPADSRSDIFSLGVVLYEMAAGVPPFRGETPTDTLLLTVQSTPIPLSVVAPTTPPELDAIVTQALRKRPEHRHVSMAALREELSTLRRKLGLRAAIASTPGAPGPPLRPSRRRLVLGWTAAAAGVIAVGTFAARGLRPPPPVSPQSILFRRVPTNSETDFGIISPDARYVAYVRNPGGVSSVWIRQLIPGGADLPLVPPQPDRHRGLAFTPDGNYLYDFVSGPPAHTRGAIYRVPTLGGAPQLILEDADSAPVFSPDGTRFVFRRGSALMLANADGGGLRSLADSVSSLPFPSFHWRTDSAIQFFAPGPPGRTADWDLFELPAGGGDPRIVVSRIPGPVACSQMADRDGLFLIAHDPESGLNQLWYLRLSGGRRYRITHDTSDYDSLSAPAAGKPLLAAQRAVANRLFLAGAGGSDAAPSPLTVLGAYGAPSWDPSGRILTTVTVGGRRDLWSIPAEGGERRQLTASGDALPVRPAIAPDGRAVVFPAGRAGVYSLELLTRDSGARRSLLSADALSAASFAPDSLAVYCSAYRDRAWGLWTVPLDARPPLRLAGSASVAPDVSPDGTRVAFASTPEEIAVLHLASHQVTAHLRAHAGLSAIRWLSAETLAYAVDTGPDRGIYRAALSGDPPRRVLTIDDQRLAGFDFIPSTGRYVYSSGSTVTRLVVIDGFR